MHSVSGIVVGLLVYPFLVNKIFWVFINGSPHEESILQLQPLPTDGGRGLQLTSNNQSKEVDNLKSSGGSSPNKWSTK